MNQNPITLTEIILELAHTLVAARHHLRTALGSDWPRFEQEVQAILEMMLAQELPNLVLWNRFLDLAEDYPEAENELAEILDRVIDPTSLESNREGGTAPDAGTSKSILDGDAPLPQYADEALQQWQDVVNTGFATQSQPQTPLSPISPLLPGKAYYFWLEVGSPVAGSLEEVPTPLPRELLPEDAILQVAVYAANGQISQPENTSLGFIQLRPTGGSFVHKPPAPLPDPLSADLAASRLFFPLTMPDSSGVFHLNCHIYYQQQLIQSRQISVEVTPTPQMKLGALRSRLTFNLSDTLESAHLAQLKPHQLSMAHHVSEGFYLFGEDGTAVFNHQAPFDAHAVQDYIDMARKAMRQAAWGDADLWHGQTYRYAGQANLHQLTQDLARLAQVGYRFYAELVGQLGAEPAKQNQLTTLLRQPGMIQLVSPESERLLFPISLVYDATLDANLDLDAYQLCPAFKEALQAVAPLEETACFQGNCPHQEDDGTVCPSGFWGYRHKLGFPLSVGPSQAAAGEIQYRQTPQLAVCVSTDPALRLRAAHENSLQTFWPANGWRYADSSEETFANLKQQETHLIYFYCHGGSRNNVPYLQVGNKSETVVTKDSLLREKIYWKQPQPLIFINGCHTAALEPETAISLVSGFVRLANAAGVIGTEITIFESLARSFAEKCLSLFLQGVPIGEAVRNSRLALLKAYNPLGLVYIPYAVASLQLVAASEQPA